MKFGVVIFPGSNCEQDCYYAIRSLLEQPVEYIWHQDTTVKGFDAVVLPGGFAYGDYRRLRKKRRDRHRHMQWISNSDRGRNATRRASSQCRIEISVQVRVPAYGDCRYPIHEFDDERPVASYPDRAWRRELLCRFRNAKADRRSGSGGLPLRGRAWARHAGSKSERIVEQHRRNCE